jgi:hypothetical protein
MIVGRPPSEGKNSKSKVQSPKSKVQSPKSKVQSPKFENEKAGETQLPGLRELFQFAGLDYFELR